MDTWYLSGHLHIDLQISCNNNWCKLNEFLIDSKKLRDNAHCSLDIDKIIKFGNFQDDQTDSELAANILFKS